MFNTFQTDINLFILWITNNIFRILIVAAVTVILEPIDFHFMNKNGKNTLQNILYCDSQKNDSQTIVWNNMRVNDHTKMCFKLFILL